MQNNVREEFKVGDWIVLTDSIGQKTFLYVEKKEYDGQQLCVVFDCEVYNLDGLYLKDCDLKVWEPKIGEKCCFYNKNSSSFRVAKFKQMCTGKKYKGYYKDMSGNQFECCEPWRKEDAYFLNEGLTDVQG